MAKLRVLSGDTPRLNPDLERGFPTFNPLDVDVVGWSWRGREASLSVLLLPPGLNRELVFLCRDLGEKFGFEV